MRRLAVCRVEEESINAAVFEERVLRHLSIRAKVSRVEINPSRLELKVDENCTWAAASNREWFVVSLLKWRGVFSLTHWFASMKVTRTEFIS